MMLILLVIISALLEALIHAVHLRRVNRFLIGLSFLLYGVIAGLSLQLTSSVFAAVSIAIIAFRIFNSIKILAQRLPAKQLTSTTRSTSIILWVLHMITMLLGLIFQHNNSSLLLILGFIQFIAATLVLSFIVFNLTKIKYHRSHTYISDKDLPTITIAIPARNETNDLTGCLETVLASNYPKMEVIVLDDCSQDSTSEIIKHYAHAGVRFLQGKAAPDNWLAKNFAYQQLAEESTGSIIIFCGVDIRIDPSVFRETIQAMIEKNKDMISIMPMRYTGGIESSLIQPMRYWWELAIPRKALNRPSVLSTFWAIKKDTLNKYGSFKAVRHNILPERYFAREVVKSDGYTFMRSNEDIPIRTVKKPELQLNTALRMRYAQLQKRPENIFILVVAEFFVLLLPFMILLFTTLNGYNHYLVLTIVASTLFTMSHVLVIAASNPSNILIGFINFPIVVATEICISLLSMYKYEFGSVMWKGRNICLPKTK
jgi:glycosyltransferase involved in cell wall biosynthesis